MLVATVQEQHDQIRALRERLDALEKGAGDRSSAACR
jgi:hypothetical protein